jgi:hypothetical protein
MADLNFLKSLDNFLKLSGRLLNIVIPIQYTPFLHLAKFIYVSCKLLLCLVFMTCISVFNTNKCIFFTTNSKIESMY